MTEAVILFSYLFRIFLYLYVCFLTQNFMLLPQLPSDSR